MCKHCIPFLTPCNSSIFSSTLSCAHISLITIKKITSIDLDLPVCWHVNFVNFVYISTYWSILSFFHYGYFGRVFGTVVKCDNALLFCEKRRRMYCTLFKRNFFAGIWYLKYRKYLSDYLILPMVTKGHISFPDTSIKNITTIHSQEAVYEDAFSLSEYFTFLCRKYQLLPNERSTLLSSMDQLIALQLCWAEKNKEVF